MNFELSPEQLLDVVKVFQERLLEGLEADGKQIKCLPCFTPMDNKEFSGKSHVLDLGGSNLRAAEVDLDEMSVSNIHKAKMPWQRGVVMAKQEYLGVQADLLAKLDEADVSKASLGYCFSYPAKSLQNGDASLIRWTKGIVVPDTEGEKVGEPLLSHLQVQHGRSYKGVAVVNDTVTSLLAGLSLAPCDAYAGLIVGTGMNLAGMFAAKDIQKLQLDSNTQYPVNFESGNFHPPHLSEFDDKLDSESENPSEQRFEKAVSGMYLGRIFAHAHPTLAFDPESGAEGLVKLISETSDSELKSSALSLYRRSAQLVSAQLCGLANVYSKLANIQTMRIVAEGGLAHSSIDGVSYFDILENNIQKLLVQLNLDKLKIEVVKVENANLIGAAIAASQVG